MIFQRYRFDTFGLRCFCKSIFFLSSIPQNYINSITFEPMNNSGYILVTGGAGYIGSHTVVELINKGYTPVIADDFRNSEERILDGIEKITGVSPETHRTDVTNLDALEKLFQQYTFTGVIHFVAYKAVGESVASPIKYYENNLLSLINCVKLCEKYKVKNLVFSSSCTVYGEPDEAVVDEKSPMKPANSPYGATKQMSEQILQDVIRSKADLKVLSLRYFNPIGAHPSGEIGELPIGAPNNLVPFITQTAMGKLGELTVFGDDYETEDGSCIRDFIHVVDLAEAHIKGLEWLVQMENTLFDVVNLGTGQGASVLEIIHTFEKVNGVSLNWKFGKRRDGDVSQIYADVTKAKQQLNWVAQKTLEDSMRDAWNWEQKLANAK